MRGMAPLLLNGQSLIPLPERALWWPAERCLLVADVHLGKDSSFRQRGVAVPDGPNDDTLARLDLLLARWQPRELLVLGDFLHAREAQGMATLEPLSAWRARHAALAITLVRGNHDDHAGDPAASLDIRVVDEPWLRKGLALCHHPQPRPAHYALAGHLHPCVNLAGRARERLRLPCFWFGPEVGVLPAFGAFTGMAPVRPAAGDRVLAVAGARLMQVPA
jgi:uncharacterized protein